MKFTATNISAVVLLVLVSVSSAVDKNRPEPLLRQDVLIEANRLLITFNRNNPVQMADFYRSNAIVQLPGLPPFTGRQNIIDTYKLFFLARPHLEVLSTNITRLADRRYVTNSTYRVTETRETGRSQRTGTFNLIWVFFGARPYVVDDFTTSD